MIQKNLIWLLGAVGGLAVIVPTIAPSPQENAPANNNNAVANIPAKSQANKTSDPQSAKEAKVAESDFDDSEVDASNFGEPVSFGEDGNSSNQDVAQPAPVAGASSASASNPKLEDRIKGLNPETARENPKALVESGLKNGSGGKINVTKEDIENAREF